MTMRRAIPLATRKWYVIASSTLVLILLLFGEGPRSVFAQAWQIDVGTRPILLAHPLQASISIDGRLDEAAWQQAEAVADFKQFEPNEGAPATQRTEVRVLYDDGNLYVGAMLYDDDPAEIEPALGRRDEYNRADWFLVSIDSYFDKRTAYTFGVNAAGVQFDAIQTSGRRSGGGGGGNAPQGMDPSWDAIWYARGRITPEGWVVEMHIPYSMLRFSDAASQTWGIHFTRRIPRLGEQSEWPHVPRIERTNLVAQFGYLTGITNIKPKRNLQISPYTLSRLQTEEHPDQPGSIARNGSFDVGGDLKIGLGPNITLDATINPDFGQVEADPAVLNLTAFETIFAERRPFFTEGMQIYDFDLGPGQLPYSRRIGAQAPIVGAAKLSGRTANGLSFGLLGASTGDHFDPTRHYGILRVNQQIGTYSSAGGILTAFDGPATDGNGRLRSVVGGADYNIRFLGNRYGLEGFAGLTHRRWTQADRDAETGLGGKLLLRKRQGTWTGFVGVEGFGETFNVNDVGRLRQNNYINLPLRIEYNINGGQPFGSFLRASVGGFSTQQFSSNDGLNLGQRHRFSSRWTLRGFQQIELGATMERPFGGYDIYETRGLGPWARPFGIEFQGAFQTDERRSWQVEPELSLTVNDDGGRGYGAGLRGNWNVGTRLSLSGNLEVEWEDDVVAWTSNETFLRTDAGWWIGGEAGSPDDLSPDDFIAFDDRGLLDAILAGVEPFDVDRYYVPVFGARNTRSLDFTLRSTVTFMPNLSLQLYSQLFLARGRYDQFQILQNRDDLAPFEPFPKRDEFTFSSLQSNVVLRWEYRPGSTLFLVWTHGRRADDALNPLAPWGSSPYNTPMDEQIADTFSLVPSNVFLVKLNYTFLR